MARGNVVGNGRGECLCSQRRVCSVACVGSGSEVGESIDGHTSDRDCCERDHDMCH